MKTASSFHLYVMDGGQIAALAEAGLETERLEDPALIEEPALVLLAPGQTAPADLAPIALEIPLNVPAGTIRELVRVAVENIELKLRVTDLESEALPCPPRRTSTASSLSSSRRCAS